LSQNCRIKSRMLYDIFKCTKACGGKKLRPIYEIEPLKQN